LAANGWQKPCGPRQKPGPQSSATLIIGALPAVTGADNIDAFAMVATDRANAAVKAKVLNTMTPPELSLDRGDDEHIHWTPNPSERHRNAAVIEHSGPTR
jgi:hypothetical protein